MRVVANERGGGYRMSAAGYELRVHEDPNEREQVTKVRARAGMRAGRYERGQARGRAVTRAGR